MTNSKKYWRGLAELNNDPAIKDIGHNEFPEEVPVDEFLSDKSLSENATSRRDFLKFLGFTTAAATLAACETPVHKVIPYVNKPESIIPGVANYFASTIYDGHDFASVLVKTREGRPIKIEPNNTCTNARVQASVLSLYDSGRLKTPYKDELPTNWDTVDSEIKKKLNEIKKRKKKGKVVLLSSTIISPSTKQLIDEFIEGIGNGSQHIQIDSISYNGILEANNENFKQRRMPTYDFEKAKVIVSFGVDFLGNWGHSDYSSQYAKGRNPKNAKEFSKHYQIESTLTLTGSNADKRIQIKPSEQANLLYNLYYALENKATADPRISKIVQDLKANKAKSIVVSNSNDKSVQIIVNAINQILGNYNSTIDVHNYSNLKQGNDQELTELINDMSKGKIGALITYNTNPSYILENADKFNKGLENVDLTISTSLYMDETSSKMQYVCPDYHNLESWGDAEPKRGLITFMQPTIKSLFNGRQFQDSILKWDGENDSYYDLLKKRYTNWEKNIHDGFYENNIEKDELLTKYLKDKIVPKKPKSSRLNGYEFEISEKISMGDGTQANNPWLQELPDPLSRACWDNYLTISATTASKLNINNWNVSNGALNGDMVNITVNGKTLRNVPVMIQPGQATDTVALAVGYGRTHAGKCGNGYGVNAYPLSSGGLVKIEKVDGVHEFASIQLHHTMMGRDMIKETTLSEYIKDPSSGNHREKYLTYDGKKTSDQVTLWDKHDHKTGHHWNLSIDLTSCIGCAACVISCHAENNVPVVGKEEMRKSRDMHWLRIDRYFHSEMDKDKAKEDNISAIKMYKEMEVPSDNPEVAFQPVMCQHCNHAPCETVCPVAATSHSAEGLNHMAYNRCVGTRYCANNCPYKVRRFNWFQYSDNDQFDFNMNNDLGKMVLNPDVVVRSRGVIEKCSMCVHKIQELKLTAKKEGRKISDKEAQTVCASSCDTGAIVFGDVNDPKHTVHNLRKDERAYDLLDHLNVAPSVFYQTKIRNKG